TRRGVVSLMSRKMPVWSVVALAVVLTLAATAAMSRLHLLDAASRGGATTSSPTRTSSIHAMAGDQLRVARGFEELAESLAARGEWSQAALQYQSAEQLYRVNTSNDAPIVAM